MMRHRENVMWLAMMVLVVLIGTVLALLYPEGVWYWVTGVGLALVCIHGVSIVRRERKLKELNAYLDLVCSGEYPLNLCDNREGELSILKSQIYKVGLMLRERADLLVRDKEQLAQALSDISHQLKTPMTSLLVMVDLLGNRDLPEEKRSEFTANINRQLERMEWLVSSLLKLAKLDAGAIAFQQEEVRVDELVKKALEPLLIPAEIKGVDLVIAVEEGCRVKADARWTAEALVNVVKNGIEHTPEGGLLKVEGRENPLYTEIIVEDDGEGICAEDLPYVFERFYRGKNASQESAGIGLAMARSMVAEQGGSLKVRSEVGKGTRFVMRFEKQVV